MILILKQNADRDKVIKMLDNLHSQGLQTNISEGTQHTIIGLIGDTSKLNAEDFSIMDIIESAKKNRCKGMDD